MVKHGKKTPDGHGLGRVHRNPLFDTWEYEIIYEDGTTDCYPANDIAENLYSQIDTEGKKHLIFKEIVNHQKDDSAITKQDGYNLSLNRNYIPKKTTRGCRLCVEWKDGMTDRIP
eukprot:10814931-Ditylum_brightwellii.AAC.1